MRTGNRSPCSLSGCAATAFAATNLPGNVRVASCKARSAPAIFRLPRDRLATWNVRRAASVASDGLLAVSSLIDLYGSPGANGAAPIWGLLATLGI